MKLPDVKKANIRTFAADGGYTTKEVNVEKVIEFGGEVFFIHCANETPSLFAVSHYITGMRTVTAPTVARVEKLFNDFMNGETVKKTLRDVIDRALTLYGAVNELEETEEVK